MGSTECDRPGQGIGAHLRGQCGNELLVLALRASGGGRETKGGEVIERLGC